MRDRKGRFVKKKRKNPLLAKYKKGKKTVTKAWVTAEDLKRVRTAKKAAKRRKLSSLMSKLGKLENQSKRRLKQDQAKQKKLKKQGYKIAEKQNMKLSVAEILEAVSKGKLSGGSVAKKKKKKAKKAKKSSKKRSAPKAKKRSSKKRASKKRKGSPKKMKKVSKRRRIRRRRKPARFITRKQKLRAAAKKARYKHPAHYKLRGRKKNKFRDVTVSVSKIKRKKNPIGGGSMFEEYTGHTIVEAGGLALGGALYGAANGFLSRIPVIKTAHAALAKVPVVGTALPTLALGAILHKLGSKQGIKALEVIGKGLVGASVVGMGVNASQMVPFLRPAPVAGVDYTVSGMGEADFGEVDFGEIPSGLGEAQMGELPEGLNGVDYTMNGVDYTMSGLGESDFGEVDFGEIPAGLGEGQMG